MGKKLTYEYVYNFISIDGYTLLTKHYDNNKSKLLVKCPSGHEYKTTFKNFQLGRRCPVCAIDNNKISYKNVKKFIESKNYTLISDSYENAKTKLLMICDRGHNCSISWNNFKSGYRCVTCGYELSAKKQRLSFSSVKQYIESYGYKLLSKSYKNARTPLLVECPEGHRYNTMFTNFKSGKRCKECSDNRLRFTINDVKKIIESYGYKLLSKSYKNQRQKIMFECPKGHKYKTTFNIFRSGKRCPICNEKSSKGEKDVQLFVESLGVNIIRNDRTQIINPLTGFNLELDIWIPSINKAIEYNGTYWHSMNVKKSYDKIKAKQCKNLNIDLLIVKEENWTTNDNMEKQIIRNFINDI